jgi:hypothetical protein
MGLATIGGDMLTNRDFFGEEHYKFILREFEAIRVRRKSLNGKPDQYQRVELALDKIFETFYKQFIDKAIQ